MKQFKHKIDVKNRLGDIVWACNYEYTLDKESKKLYQEPIKGMLTCGSSEKYNNTLIEEGCNLAYYFVPFKKNGAGLAWSKAVRIEHRHFANTEEECIELYNSIIKEKIKWHEEQLKELREHLIHVDNGE